MKPVKVIGMGLGPEDLTQKHLDMIRQADLLVGGRRHLGHFDHLPIEKAAITADLNGLLTDIQGRMQTQQVVVLASGDPLFFGIGQRMLETLGPENVKIYPNVSSVSAAFARIKLPWQHTPVLSLHGRQSTNRLRRTLRDADQVAVLTDPVQNPQWLAEWLQREQFGHFRLCVLEKLGSPEEKHRWLTPSEAVKGSFDEPNLVVLKRAETRSPSEAALTLGMPDRSYAHQRGMITKAEVRAVTLSKLRLQSDHVLWDLGAGSGSIAIEASLLIQSGKIFAVEKDPVRVEQINANKQRYGISRLTVVRAELPDGLADLPKPDRVFIGGGGPHLDQIIRSVVNRLAADGIVVVNTVLVSSLHQTLSVFNHLNRAAEVVQVQIHRSRPMPHDVRLEAENPVWVIAAGPPVKQPLI